MKHRSSIANVVLVAALSPFVAGSAAAESILLNELAVSEGTGSLATPLGTSVGKTTGVEKLFDGDGSTFFEHAVYPSWGGIKLTEPCVLTHVEYYPRPSWMQRMRGCLVQGANTSDFSDAKTLIVCMPVPTWTANTWKTQYALLPAATNAYSYFRLWCNPTTYNGSCAGNCTEMKFFGRKASAVAPTPAAAPTVTLGVVMNGAATFRLANVADDQCALEVERKDGTGAWTSCAFEMTGESDVTVRDVTKGPVSFRLRYANGSTVSGWTEQSFATVAHAIPGSYVGVAQTGQYGGWCGENNSSDSNVSKHFSGPFAFDGTLGEIVHNPTGAYWTGLDFGTERTISAIRYVPRLDAVSYANICCFEVANEPDFSDAKRVVALGSDHEARLYEVTLATPVKARYARFRKNGSGIYAFAEVEFVSPVSAEVPADCAVTSSGQEDDFAVVSWTPKAGQDKVVVETAPGPGGPWSEAAVVDASLGVWTNVTEVAGVPLWYRVALRDGDQTGVFTQVVGHRRVLRLERDWNNLSTLKAGVTIATSKGASQPTGCPFTAAFDNNTSTYPDMGQPFAKIGVDLGGEFALAYVRAYPRQGWAANRMNNTICYASGEPVTGAWESTGVPVTPPFVCTGMNWVNAVAMRPQYYRTFWLSKPYADPGQSSAGNYSFYGNVSEIEFYGWPKENTVNRLGVPEELHVMPRQKAVDLAWNACNLAETYRVERCEDFADVWTLLGVTGTTRWSDATAVSGKSYAYRVTSVKGTESAVSATVSGRLGATDLGCGWEASEAFGTSFAGEATVDAVAEAVTLTTAGGDLKDDRCRYLWRNLRKNFEFEFRYDVQNMSGLTAFKDGQKVALMLRDGLGEGGVFVAPAVKLETTGCSVGVYTRLTADGAVAAPATWTALDDSFVSGFFKVRRVYDRVEVWIKGVESAEWTSLGAYTLTGLDNEVSVGAAVACEYARERVPYTSRISQTKYTKVPFGFCLIFK